MYRALFCNTSVQADGGLPSFPYTSSCVLVALLAGLYVLLVGSATALPTGLHMLFVRSMVTAASLSAFAGDLALFGFIHRSESAVAFFSSHEIAPNQKQNVRRSTNDCHSRERIVKRI